MLRHALSCTLAFAGAACPTAILSAADPATVTAAVRSYADGASQAYAQALGDARALQAAVRAFVAAPSEAGLGSLRTAWIAARTSYSPTEVYRFAGGPIDGTPDNVETKINAWPLDEQWIEALIAGGSPLDRAAVVAANEQDGEKNITLGYHAIEYLLWGADRDPAGPGRRTVAELTPRHLAVLAIAADDLVERLQGIAAAHAGPWRSELLAKPAEALKGAFTGAVLLAGDELSGERMAVAYETQDQEEEQSCFSDQTNRDIQLNAAGVQAVWRQLAPVCEPQAAAAATAAVDAAVAACAAIPAPFDRAIQGGNADPGRRAVLAAIEALERAADALMAAARSAGVAVEFGVNPNNAILAFQQMRLRIATIAIGDAAAMQAVEALWLKAEAALRDADPARYQATEAAIQGLRTAVVRDRSPTPAKLAAAVAALDAALDACIGKLKTN